MAFFLLMAAAVWAAPAQDIPEELKPVLTRLGQSVPGAELVKLHATVGLDGYARCPGARPSGRYEGWGIVLQPSAGRPWVALECLAEPPRQAYMERGIAISGGFIGIERALEAARTAGARWGPDAEIRAELSRPLDAPEAPPLWRLSAKGQVNIIDALTGKIVKTGRQRPTGMIGAVVSDGRGSMEESLEGELEQLKASLEQSPLGPPVRRHFMRVLAFIKKERPRAVLMAIEGVTEGGGRSLCAPPFNGWTYTAYDYGKKEYAFYQECGGRIGPRSRVRLPVDFRSHVPLPEKFIDSSEAASLASKNASHIMLLVHQKAGKCLLTWRLNQPLAFKSGEEAYLRSYASGSQLILDASEIPAAPAAKDPKWRYRCGGTPPPERDTETLDGVRVAPVRPQQP